MGRLSFRKLKADEIDCRISTVSANGISLLLYKDARVDQNILDETVGPMDWQKSYTRDNANCIVEIWDSDKKQWIHKEDTGTESNTEKEKGLASDSFKRACFCWGIGRELYTAPFIWIKKGDCEIKEAGADGRGKMKYTCYDRFKVSVIGYDSSGSINKLSIKHQGSHKVVYQMGKSQEEEPEKAKEMVYLTVAQVNTLIAQCERTGIGRRNVYSRYGATGFEKMTIENFTDAMEKLRTQPDRPDTTPPDQPEGGLPWNQGGEVVGS